ncbi:MAG TPA: hypothetical protein VIF15_18745 [Polyangiaceae bacterium]
MAVAAAAGALLPTTARTALAQEADGGAASAREGPPIDPVTAPDASGGSAWTRACSFRHPLCVLAGAGTPDRLSLATLSAADRAWDVLTGALGLPPPDGGAGTAWRVFLVDGIDGGGTALLDARDPVAHFDRASSFALVDRRTPPGCLLDRALARAVARGSLWRAAPATDPGSARAETHMLARLATPTACAPDDDDVRVFQGEPERTLVDPASPRFDRGASLFFDWLDAKVASQPGALVAGLWALAPTRTPAAAWRWSGTPTGFDVMRVSLAGALWPESTLDDVFVRFAVARALLDPPVRLAWHVPWPGRARRFASPQPVSPTGASYVVVDHTGAAPGARLRVEAAWEDYGRMRWVILKLDAAGHVLADIPVTSLNLVPRASMTVEALDGVDRLMLVGVDVGSTEHRFDPDQGEWEPHGWLLTVEGE